MSRALTLLSVIILCCACSSTPPQQPQYSATPVEPLDRSHIYLEISTPGSQIPFLGKLRHDEAEKLSAAMMYPGYNAGGFLAAILTHAIVQSGIESSEKRAQQETANGIVSKYLQGVERISGDFLTGTDRTVTSPNDTFNIHTSRPANSNQNLYLVRAQPVFYMASSERSINLINRLSFSESENPDADHKTVIVEYVSDSYNGTDPLAYWSENNYQALLDTAFSLFSSTLDLALINATSDADHNTPKKTIRYLEDGTKKVERGQVLEDSCQRITFVTLRGSIKSVPTLSQHREQCGLNAAANNPALSVATK